MMIMSITFYIDDDSAGSVSFVFVYRERERESTDLLRLIRLIEFLNMFSSMVE